MHLPLGSEGAPTHSPSKGSNVGDSAPLQDEGTPSKRPRSTEAAVDLAVQRAIKQHFGRYDATSMMEVTVFGERLFSYVRRCWIAARASHKNLTAGWWAELHEHMEGFKDWVDLEPAANSGEPDPLFCVALEECHAKNPAFRRCTKMDHYLRSCQRNLQHIEICALFNSVAKSNRTRSNFAADYGLAVARYVARRQLTQCFPLEVGRMLPFFDKAITALYGRQKKSGITRGDFMQMHRQLVELVLPRDDLSLVLEGEHREAWGEIAPQVRRVVEAGELGKALYKDALSKVQAAHWTQRVTVALQDFAKLKAHDEVLNSLPILRKDLADLAAEAGRDKLFVASPTISVEFLGAKLKIQSGDAAKEVNIRLEATLRNMSVCFNGGGVPLPHEAWLFPERAAVKALVPREELQDNGAARTLFNMTARRNANTMLCQLVSMVDDSKAKIYLDLDPFFVLEVLFLRCSAENLCNAVVRKRLFACLPDETNQPMVEEALRQVKALRLSPIVAEGELGEGAQLLDAVEEQLHAITCSEGPTIGDNPSEIKQKLFDAYSYFFQLSAEVARPGSTPFENILRGKEAFNVACDVLREKHANRKSELTFMDLKRLSGFRFLMSPEVEAEYRTWVVAAMHNTKDERKTQEETCLVEVAAQPSTAAASSNAAPAASPEEVEATPPKKQLRPSGEGRQQATVGRGRGRGRGLGTVPIAGDGEDDGSIPAAKASTGKQHAKATKGMEDQDSTISPPAAKILDLFGKKYSKIK